MRFHLPIRSYGILGVAYAVALAIAGPAAWQSVQRRAAENAPYPPPPPGMALVPAGYATVGSNDPSAPHDEHPARRVWLPAFYIDIHEVTNRDYAAYNPEHTYRKGHGDYPVVKITRAQAEAYARARGKRLPTAVEWEKAARGADGRVYPWGNEWLAGHANLATGEGLQPVGSYLAGASPYGALDMAGNAWEWVSDTYIDGNTLGHGLETERGIIKGGAYAYSAFQGRAAYNGFEHEITTCGDLSFRCVKDVE